MEDILLLRRVGAAIRARRVAMGLSQDGYADRIGMHRAYYAAIERGERNVTLTTLHRVAGGLGTTMGVVLTEADV